MALSESEKSVKRYRGKSGEAYSVGMQLPANKMWGVCNAYQWDAPNWLVIPDLVQIQVNVLY